MMAVVILLQDSIFLYFDKRQKALESQMIVLKKQTISIQVLL